MIASEIKGLFMSCGNAALALRRSGAALEDCVVPGICYAGDGFRFVALYFIEP